MTTLSFDDVSVEVFALPGHHYNYIYPFLPALLARTNPDVVLFDLASTPCRGWSNPNHLNGHLNGMLKIVSDHGAQAGLIHFYDDGIDAAQDPVLSVLNLAAAKLGLPVADMSQWWRESGKGVPLPVNGTLRSVSDAVTLSQQIVAFVRETFASLPPQSGLSDLPIDKHVRSLVAADASSLADPSTSTETFLERGLSSQLLLVEEGATVTLQVPEGVLLNGIYFIHGPKAGDVEITSDRGLLMIQRCYDAWSYSERPVIMNMDSKGARWIAIRQLPGLPDQALAQGEPDRGPRLGKIGPVMMYVES